VCIAAIGFMQPAKDIQGPDGMQRRQHCDVSPCIKWFFYQAQALEEFGTPVANFQRAPAVRGLGIGTGTAGTDPYDIVKDEVR